MRLTSDPITSALVQYTTPLPINQSSYWRMSMGLVHSPERPIDSPIDSPINSPSPTEDTIVITSESAGTNSKKKRTTSPSNHHKPCTLCNTPRDVLVRCQIDDTGKWHFVCPGNCWKQVSGGVVDGDKMGGHEWYRYGGMWKNKHAGVSAKKPKAKKKSNVAEVGEVKDS